MAWGPGEDAAREWFRASAAALGLEVVQDPAGNLWAIEPGGAEGPFDAVGSHLDSVADGGAFDGALGVVAGFVAVEAARRAGGAARPLAVGAMVDEEGPRFGAAIFGSRALCGELDVDEVLARTDPEGNVLRDLAALRGVTRGDASAPRPPSCRAWPRGSRCTSSRAGASSTCPRRSASRRRWPRASAGAARVRGVSDHAGTAAMAGRRDALVPAARAVLAAHELALAEPGAVATVGRISALPGSTNQVPGRGAPEPRRARARAGGARARARRRARRRPRRRRRDRVDCSRRPIPAASSTTRCAARCTTAARAEGHEAIDMAAYAGHDAGVLARHLPAAMLFVRNPTGISHNPAESASEEDCLAACAVLARRPARARPC